MAVFPADWFWFVAGDETRVYSSAEGDYLDSTDNRFLTWANRNAVSRIASESELVDVLKAFNCKTGVLAPDRVPIRKSTVVTRLIAAGLIEEALSALLANAAAFARWTAPDWPEVYQDDEDVLGLLGAIGADPTVILAAE